MPKVTFAKDFNYTVPGNQVTVAYKAGMSLSIPKAHAEAAEAAGVLEKGTAEGKSDDDSRATD